MCVCHGFPGAEGQSMLGRVEQRQDGASRLENGEEWGWGKESMELETQRGLDPQGQATLPDSRGTCLEFSCGPSPCSQGQSRCVPVPKSGTCDQTAFGGSDLQRKAVRAHGDPGVWDPGASPKGQLGSCTPGTETERELRTWAQWSGGTRRQREPRREGTPEALGRSRGHLGQITEGKGGVYQHHGFEGREVDIGRGLNTHQSISVVDVRVIAGLL